MAERASTHWLDCARTSSRQIPSRDVCFCSAADGALRSASWSMTGRRSGWRRSGCRRGDLCGGPAERSRPGCCKRRSEEHTSELQSPCNLVCRLLLEKKIIEHVAALEPLLHRSLAPPPGPRLDGLRCWRLHRRGGPYRRSGAGVPVCFFFFFNDPAPPEIYPLSLPGPLPI